MTNILSDFDTFSQLIASFTCNVRIYNPLKLDRKFLSKIYLEVAFEVTSSFLVSRIVVAEKKKIHVLNEFGFTKLMCTNEKEEKKLKRKILQILEALKR